MSKTFMTVNEAADELSVSKSYAYKIVQKLNEELKNMGYITVSGRINKRYFLEKVCYGKERLNMSAYKEEKTNTWRVIYRYTDWTGERKQSQKRGFATKKEALAWEREQLQKVAGNLDMTFESFIEIYTADTKKTYERKHMGNQTTYYSHQAAPLLWQPKNRRYSPKRYYRVAKRDD